MATCCASTRFIASEFRLDRSRRTVAVDLARRASQDAGERGIENVVVSLYEAATGTLIGTRASDVTDKYQCKFYFILGFF